jgi:fumarate hydratase class II
MATIKRAAAEVNQDLGILEAPLAEAIGMAAEEVRQGDWDQEFVVDPFQAGAGTSHNMNTNEVIANRATQILGGDLGAYLVHPNDHVNMSQSTNDTIPTAIRLGCLWRREELLDAYQQVFSTLDGLSVQFEKVLKSGRTHLQDAVPIRLGQEFSAYAEAVKRDQARVELAMENLGRLAIGGTAVGTGLNAPSAYHRLMVERMSQITGFQLQTSGNLFEGMQSMADMVDFSASLRTSAVTFIRIANDLRLLSSGPSTGINEIRLPVLQPGSSIMPGKVNPVVAEMVNMAMFHVIGCDQTVMLASQAGQLEINVMMPIIAHNLFEMMQVMIGSLEAFTDKCLAGIQANQEIAMDWLEKNPIVVTALNSIIGYEKGAEIVKESAKSGRTIREIAITLAQGGKLTRRDSDQAVTPAEITNALSDLYRMTEGGIMDEID